MTNYADQTYTVDCPYCATPGCEADWVDVDVGLVQCGPFHCDECGAVQMGPEDPGDVSEEERKVGWYRADHAHHTCAPTVGGVLVGDHRVAAQLYELGLLDEKAPLPGPALVDRPVVDADPPCTRV